MTYRNRILLSIIAVAIAIGVGFVALLSFLSFAFSDLCGNEELETIYSPDGARKVVVFELARGATTGFSTQVSLLRAGQSLPNEPGNLFVADTNHVDLPLVQAPAPFVAVRWVGDTELLLTYGPGARVFHSAKSLEGVTVRCEQR
jgi:hypothetical protein